MLMRLALTTAALVVAAGAALAQSSPNTPNSAGTQTPSQLQSATPPTATPPSATPTTANPAIGAAQSAPSSKAAAGSNSFTQRQAANRIRRAGYTDVTGLKKDGRGVWRGTAQKDGSPVSVSLDYRGNVVSQ